MNFVDFSNHSDPFISPNPFTQPETAPAWLRFHATGTAQRGAPEAPLGAGGHRSHLLLSALRAAGAHLLGRKTLGADARWI